MPVALPATAPAFAREPISPAGVLHASALHESQHLMRKCSVTHRTRDIAICIAAMVVVVTGSNVLVQFVINDWLTLAAFTYPIAFLVTDLTNRRLGPGAARRVVYAGFGAAVVFSALLATPRIAVASATAFLVAQLLDIYVFNRLRDHAWWTPPLVSSLLGSVIDSILFFAMAFAGTGVPWITLGLGDFAIKVLMALVLLIPFRGLLRWTAPQPLSAVGGRA
jgi:queuosine precursor transporter